MNQTHTISTMAELEALYDKPNTNSLAKESVELTGKYREWLEQARFFTIASKGPAGLDCSPRGDTHGQAFKVLDKHHIVIPDRRGNNRIDTLRNIVSDPHIALLFLIPGINEALRINGQATVTTDPQLLALFTEQDKAPMSVISVNIDAVYFQCARALIRSSLWESSARLSKDQVPTAGQMTQSVLKNFDANAYDSTLYTRQKDTLY